MAHTIQWSSSIKISGGPQISFSKSVKVEAYDVIQVTIIGTDTTGGPDTDKEVEIQPGSTSGQVTFLAITSDRYDADLTYTVNDSGNSSIALDEPHVLVGQGAVGLLDPASSPTSLFFSSNISENAEIQILVGRDAIPPSPSE